MKLSVLANLYGSKSLEETLQILTGLGVHTVELGAGGYPGKAHCNPAELLADPAKYDAFIATLKKYDVEVCALACHGNALHPDKAIAESFDTDFRNAVLLAEKMGVDTVITFSGCPGDHEGAKYPNWVTCPWPEDFLAILDWQWNEKVIPYWQEAGAFALAHNVPHIAFEMHPGFCVYNPATLLRLRAAVGPVIGANFDPSHLVWQGMDPALFLRDFADRVYHVHMKDVKVRLDGRAGILGSHIEFGDLRRGWNFVSLGHGNVNFDDITRELNACGYDGPLSVEWEDSGMERLYGAKEAYEFTKKMNFEPSNVAFDAALKTE